MPQGNPVSQEDMRTSKHTPPGAPIDASDVSAPTSNPSTASSPPAVPTRPYLPPRPFPPRPNSGNKRDPAKSKRSPQHPGRKVVKAQTAMSLTSKKRSRDHAAVPPPVRSPVPESPDNPDSRAIMDSVEVSQVETNTHVPEHANTPTLSITNHDVVQFGFPSDHSDGLSPTSPNYDSSLPATVDVSASLPTKMSHTVRESSLEGLTEERNDEVQFVYMLYSLVFTINALANALSASVFPLSVYNMPCN